MKAQQERDLTKHEIHENMTLFKPRLKIVNEVCFMLSVPLYTILILE